MSKKPKSKAKPARTPKKPTSLQASGPKATKKQRTCDRCGCEQSETLIRQVYSYPARVVYRLKCNDCGNVFMRNIPFPQ